MSWGNCPIKQFTKTNKPQLSQLCAEENALNRFLRSYIRDLPIGRKYTQYFPMGLLQLASHLCVKNVEL